MFRFRQLPLLFFLLSASRASYAGILRVQVQSIPVTAPDGSSWATAFPSITAALASAKAKDEIWVARGTYVGYYKVLLGAALYGGFAGTEIRRDQRDWNRNPTILATKGGYQAIRFNGPLASAATVDGFRFRPSNPAVEPVNGPILCDESAPRISHNTFTGYSQTLYGVVSCQNMASPTIVDNVFMGNGVGGGHGYLGGVIYVGTSSSPRIINNTIVGNAGAAIAFENASGVVKNNIIAFNAAGILNSVSSLALVVRNNCFFGNDAYNASGIPDPVGTDGNFQANPLLAGLRFGNVHIQPNSPCRDAGDDTAASAGDADSDGLPRILGAHVDVGADESDGRLWKAGPMVMRIRPDGDDANDGASWAKAMKTPQAAVDALANTGGEVWVAAGTYLKPTISSSYAVLTLFPGIYVYGGFAGTETRRVDRSPQTRVSIMDGVGLFPAVLAPSGYRVSGVDGFTLRNGGVNYRSNYAGVVFCQFGSPEITHNVISNGKWWGVSCLAAAPLIADNVIENNLRGGVYSDYNSIPIITRNRIQGNSVGQLNPQLGGGVVLNGNAVVVSDNVISGNGGGGVNDVNTFNYVGSDSPRIASNLITGNQGDASYFNGGVWSFNATDIVVNNTIVFNTGFGIGIRRPTYVSAMFYIANNILAQNTYGVPDFDATSPFLYNDVFENSLGNYSGPSFSRTSLTGINGNVSVDPRFVDPANGDFHLSAVSFLVDAGEDGAVLPGDTDLDGGPRIRFTHVDVGAYESR